MYNDNEDGYSISDLLAAQSKQLESEKGSSATAQISNSLSKVDLTRLGKSLGQNSPLSKKEDLLNQSISSTDLKYKTIAIPSGYEPIVSNKELNLNTIGVSPTFIDVETVEEHLGDIEILNPNSAFQKAEDSVIIHDDDGDVNKSVDESSGAGYMAIDSVGVTSGKRISKSTAGASYQAFDDFMGLEEYDTNPKEEERPEPVVVDVPELIEEDLDMVFDTGSEIGKVMTVEELVSKKGDSTEFDELDNSLEEARRAIEEVRRLKMSLV